MLCEFQTSVWAFGFAKREVIMRGSLVAGLWLSLVAGWTTGRESLW